jgi:hypothetical protein
LKGKDLDDRLVRRLLKGYLREDFAENRAKASLHTRQLNPEVQNLATAILVQALKDWLSVGNTVALESEGIGREQDCREWLFSDAAHPGSFCWFSEIIRLDMKGLRSWLRLYEESDNLQRRELTGKLERMATPHQGHWERSYANAACARRKGIDV